MRAKGKSELLSITLEHLVVLELCSGMMIFLICHRRMAFRLFTTETLQKVYFFALTVAIRAGCCHTLFQIYLTNESKRKSELEIEMKTPSRCMNINLSELFV